MSLNVWCFLLTYNGIVSPYDDMYLGQHKFRWRLVAWWLLNSEVLGYSPEGHFIMSAQATTVQTVENNRFQDHCFKNSNIFIHWWICSIISQTITMETYSTKILWAHNIDLAKTYLFWPAKGWSDHVTIMHMAWQLSCHDMCKIVTWLEP